ASPDTETHRRRRRGRERSGAQDPCDGSRFGSRLPGVCAPDGQRIARPADGRQGIPSLPQAPMSTPTSTPPARLPARRGPSRLKLMFWLLIVPLALAVGYFFVVLKWNYSNGERAG